MAVRSIIDIDLDDSKFVAFKNLYDKYDASLSKMPAQWAKVSSGAGASKAIFQTMLTTTAVVAAQMKLIVDTESVAEKSAKRHATSWQSMARSTKDFASNVRSATVEFAKWTGIIGVFSGLLGAGGLFGIERLAGAATAGRRTAGGLGISYGQNQAFGLNYKRFVDADSVLANVSNALHDFRSPGYVGLLSSGISPEYANTHNAADVSAELLHRLPQLFRGVPQAGVGARLSSLNLDQILSQQDVIRYLSANPAERAKQEGNYRNDVRSLDLDPDTQRAWNNFTTQMERAGSQIETTFVRGLAPLEPSLEKLSASFEHFISKFLDSDLVKTGIDKLSAGLNTFADYISSPEFEKNIEGFVEGIGKLADSVVSALKFLGVIPEYTVSNADAGIPGPAKTTKEDPGVYHGILSDAEQAARLRKYNGSHGLPIPAGLPAASNQQVTDGLPQGSSPPSAAGWTQPIRDYVNGQPTVIGYVDAAGHTFFNAAAKHAAFPQARSPMAAAASVDAQKQAIQKQADYTSNYAKPSAGNAPPPSWAGTVRGAPQPMAPVRLHVQVDNAAGANVYVSGDSLAHGP